VSLHAEDPKFQASVCVKFQGEDSLKSDVESYVKRELRSLGDVKITDDAQADYTIVLDAHANSLADGHRVGYSVAVLVTEPFRTNTMAMMVSQPEFLKLFGGFVIVDTFATSSGPDLRKICADVVTDFDSIELEHARALFGKVLQIYKQSQSRDVPTNDVPAWTNTIPAGPP